MPTPPTAGGSRPSPTGLLHLGHARTFWTASQRARAASGALVLRNDDLDAARYRMDFAEAMLEDLRWMGFTWDEGPDIGGPHAPYSQSGRRPIYRAALERLHAAGHLYPCARSRRDVIEAAGAPHEGGGSDEPIYPAAFRPDPGAPVPALGAAIGVNWRLRVPDGAVLAFDDGRLGPRARWPGAISGTSRSGARTTARAISSPARSTTPRWGSPRWCGARIWCGRRSASCFIYRALGRTAPRYYHCPLMTDEDGVRLAKRHDALSLRTLRAAGASPESIRAAWEG